MPLDPVLIWIAIGLISGWLVSAVVGGGYGIMGDIAIGIVGSFLGGLIFQGLHVHSPVGGLAGTILVAFVGAIVLLLVLRLIRSAGPRGV